MLHPVPPSELELFWKVNTDEDEDKKSINPYEVIHDFFTTYDLKSVRQDLWALLKLALENPHIMNEKPRIGDFIFLYEKFNDLITANYILNRENAIPEEEAPSQHDTITQTTHQTVEQ